MNLTDIFLKILSMSLTASYCVLFICIARLLLRRAPKIFSYLLWSIVAVRLLCPISFEGSFSLVGHSLAAFTDRIEAGSENLGAVQPLPQSGNQVTKSYSESNLPTGNNDAGNKDAGNITAGNRAANGSGIDNSIANDDATYDNGMGNITVGNNVVNDNGTYNLRSDNSVAYNNGINNYNINNVRTNDADQGSHSFSPITSQILQTALTAAAYIWFAGMLGLLAYCIFSYLRLHRSLARKAAYPYLYKNICVYVTAGLDTPFVMGLAKPAIYLPTGLEEWEALQCLAHEYTHIRRKDYLIKQAAFLLACVYWFQPLVWLAFHLMSRDMEMSCDEITLRDADLEDRKAYSSALVRLSSETPRFSGCPIAFSENNTSSRIKNILNLKKPAAWITVVCTALLIVFTAGLLTNPVNAGENKNDTDVSSTGSAGLPLDKASGGTPAQLIADSSLGGHLANRTESGSDTLNEVSSNPYPILIQTSYQELQTAYQQNNAEKAKSIQQEMKSLMTSYWTALIEEKRAFEKELKQIQKNHSGFSNYDDEEVEDMFAQLRLLESRAAQAKTEMGYMNKTMDAIEGSVNMVKAADYETAYPLYGILSESDTIVRSLPKKSAPQVDVLAAGDIVTIISFGRYILLEDPNFSDFLLSDEETLQEYQNFAVVLYQPGEANGTARKGYINIDALDISGNTAETYLYWIGKTWSEAFCSQDGAALYQMAADKKSFAEWNYVDSIQSTNPVQVKLNTSNPYPQHFYHVSLQKDKGSNSLTSSDTDDIALQFFVQTSESGVWVQRQDLKTAGTARQLQNLRRIDDLQNQAVYFSEVKNYEQITSCSEYQNAYLATWESGPSYFDFTGSGYAALYNSELPIYLVNQTLSAFALESAEALLEKYLNLFGGSAESDIMTLRLREGDRITGLTQLICVEYTFAKADENGQNKITIPMYYDKKGNLCIWMPGQDEAMDAAIYRMQENMSLFTP